MLKRPQESLLDHPKATGILEEFARLSDFGACLVPLLHAVGYRGDLRHVAEALPHFAESLDLTGLRNVMANLTFQSHELRLGLGEIDPRLLPCLFVPDQRGAMVVYEHMDDMLLIFDGATGQIGRIPRIDLVGSAFFFKTFDHELMALEQNRLGWLRMVSNRFRRYFYFIVALTCAITILQIAPPLYSMAVYDRVIGSHSMETLVHLVIGVLLALGFDWLLRAMRARILMHVGAHLDSIVSNAIFLRILSLVPSYTERAPIGSQVARIKDFDTVREFFTGPLALVFLEMPFTIIFVVVMAMLAGSLAFIPGITAVLFVVLWFAMSPLVENEGARARRLRAKQQEFTVELLNKIRAIKYLGAEEMWFDRYRELSAESAMQNFRSALITAGVNTVAQLLVIGSGLITVSIGVLRVLAAEMTVGGLVASMILVWRILAPLQSIFFAMTRMEQLRSSVKQIDGLMNVKPEFEAYAPIEPIKRFAGAISFVRVSLRYTNEAEPALMGVSFEVKPGEVVVIVGSNGSGKSTVIKLLAGLYLPQAGSIRIDGQDIRQMNPIELRHAVAYVPQKCDLYHGTIAQNLRLAHATATMEELETACQMAGVLEEVRALPRGFDTRIGDGDAGQLASSMVQKLSLARAYLKPSQILLFDEPASALDWEGDQAFQKVVNQLRGQATLFIVTHRPSHMRLADQLFFFDQGYLKLAGPPNDVLPKIPQNLI
ncbi:MAG: peptidase domain-containing ABC transporter [Magnetococcales bacterium]|nr:peptidase domain-containing ABC transporter [Magnetococcales bacterium]